jgi:MFS transporter, TsgA protein
MNWIIGVAFMTFIFQGVTFPLGSAMILEIAGKYHVDTAVIGYMLSLSFIGGGLATLGGSYLLNRWKVQNLLYTGIGFSVLAALSITASSYLAVFALGMVFFGLGTWSLAVVGNYLIVRQYAGPKRASQLNLANFFFSLGALVTPVFCGYALQNGMRWEYIFSVPFTLLIGLAAIVGLAFSQQHNKYPGIQGVENQPPASSREKWGSNVYLAAAALGFYCIFEVGYMSWIVVHLREGLAYDIVAASMALTIFYTFHALGRVISGVLVKYLPLNKFILVCTAIGIIVVSLILYTTNYMVILALTAVMAVGIGGLYPSILSYGTLQVENPSPQLVTFFMSAGLVGAIAGLILTSYLKQAFGVLTSIGSGAVAAAFVIVCISMTLTNKQKPSECIISGPRATRS